METLLQLSTILSEFNNRRPSLRVVVLDKENKSVIDLSVIVFAKGKQRLSSSLKVNKGVIDLKEKVNKRVIDLTKVHWT